MNKILKSRNWSYSKDTIPNSTIPNRPIPNITIPKTMKLSNVCGGIRFNQGTRKKTNESKVIPKGKGQELEQSGQQEVESSNPVIKHLKEYKCSDVDATTLYKELITNYVLEEDIIPISEVTKKKNFAVSFRDAGKYSLDKLAAGAGAKGHKILEKTIKPSSVGEEFKKYCEEQKKAAESQSKNPETLFKDYIKTTYIEGIEGLVAHWENGKVVGLYLTTKGKRYFERIDSFRDRIEYYNDVPVLCIKGLSSKEMLFPKKSGEVPTSDDNSNWETYFFTGDYDMHDLYNCEGQGSTIPSDSEDERMHIKYLRDAMSGGEKIESEYMKIQHGPQVSYIAYTLDLEPGEKIVYAVANIANNVAICDRGNWGILKSPADILNWYNSLGKAKPKATWQDMERKISDYVENTSGLKNVYADLLFLSKKRHDEKKRSLYDIKINDLEDEAIKILLNKSKTNYNSKAEPKAIIPENPNFSDLLYEINKKNSEEESKKNNSKPKINGTNVRKYISEIVELYKYEVCKKIWENKIQKNLFIGFLKEKKPFNILSNKDRDSLIKYFENIENFEAVESIDENKVEFEKNLEKLNWGMVYHFAKNEEIFLKLNFLIDKKN